jgi:hypothetical protein
VASNGSLFNSVALLCSGLGPAGVPAGDIAPVPVIETGDMQVDDAARCGAGQALHGIQTTTGSLLDQLKLSCASMACVPPP